MQQLEIDGLFDFATENSSIFLKGNASSATIWEAYDNVKATERGGVNGVLWEYF